MHVKLELVAISENTTRETPSSHFISCHKQPELYLRARDQSCLSDHSCLYILDAHNPQIRWPATVAVRFAKLSMRFIASEAGHRAQTHVFTCNAAASSTPTTVYVLNANRVSAVSNVNTETRFLCVNDDNFTPNHIHTKHLYILYIHVYIYTYIY